MEPIKFKEIQSVCPWCKTYPMFGGGKHKICEPVQRVGKHGTYNDCKYFTCPLWALESLKREKKGG